MVAAGNLVYWALFFLAGRGVEDCNNAGNLAKRETSLYCDVVFLWAYEWE